MKRSLYRLCYFIKVGAPWVVIRLEMCYLYRKLV